MFGFKTVANGKVTHGCCFCFVLYVCHVLLWMAWHALCCSVQYVRRAMSNGEKLELIIVGKNQVLGSVFH